MADPPTLAEYNAILAQCGCCEMPRCCPPAFEFRARLCDSNACGWEPLTPGAAGEPLASMFRKREEKHEMHDFGSASHSRTYTDGSGRTYTGSSQIDEQIKSIESYELLTPSLSGSIHNAFEYPFFLNETIQHIVGTCHGQNATTCEEEYLYHLNESGDGHNVSGPGGYVKERKTVSDMIDPPGSAEPYCGRVTVIDTMDETGNGAGNPAIPSIPSLGNLLFDFYDVGDAGTCTRGGSSISTITLHKARTVTESTPDNGEYSYSYTGSRERLEKKTVTFSMAVNAAAFDSFVRARLDDAAIPWLYSGSGVNLGMAMFFTSWPVWPPPDSGSDDDDECAEPARRIASAIARAIQYRIKLNKCCGYKTVRSEWLEVFYPRDYLEWLATISDISDPSEWPANPGGITVTPRVWEWTGTPPLCRDSDSAASDSDPFDEESMWSPWSATVKVPAGKEGVVVLKGYKQRCYGNLIDDMPEVLGEHTPDDSVPDEP